MLYRAKLYLMTKELFAWTVVIVLLAAIFEKLVMLAIKSASERVMRG
jgi:NitT/TauT family transport system permease protein